MYLINTVFYDNILSEESHSGYCTGLENRNPAMGSWVRVPLPPPALVVQRIEHRFSKPRIEVRFLSRAHLRIFNFQFTIYNMAVIA